MFRIESFPQLDNAAGDSQREGAASVVSSCSETIHVCIATAQKLSSSDGVICTIGRRNATLVFESDKCVSRKHCTIRMVVSPAPPQYPWLGPQSKEEERFTGVTLVVTDMGSKYGTFLMKPAEHQSVDMKKTNKEDDDTDTDDEVEAPNSFRWNNNVGSGMNLAVETKLEPNQSYPLVFSSASSENSVWIRCGVSGSLVRATLLPTMIFCMGTSISNKYSQSLLASIGARQVLGWSNELCTHLILENDDKVTSKRLCAWLCGKPVCTPAFIQAFLDLSSPPATLLPNPKDFIPSVKRNSTTMLLQQSSPTKDHVTLLSNFVFLFLQEDQKEFIPLVEAAGAEAVALFKRAKNEEKEQCVNNLKTEFSKITLIAVTPLDNSKKDEETLQWENILKCKFHVPFMDSTSLAQTIISNKKPEESSSFSVNQMQEAETSEDNHDTQNDNTRSGDEQEQQQPSIDVSTSEDIHATHNTKEEKNKVIEIIEQPPTLRSAPEPEWQGRPKKKQKHDRDLEEKSSTLAVDPVPPKNTPHAETGTTSSPLKRKRLPRATKDGWLSVAPRDADKRTAYRGLDVDQLRNEGCLEEAITEFRSDLIIEPKQTNKTMQSSNTNFKKFRKNFVFQGVAQDVTLVAVLPKETARQRELELTQRQIEEEEILVDTLFNPEQKRQTQIRKKRL